MKEIQYLPPLSQLDNLVLAAEIKKYNHQEFDFFKNGYYLMNNISPFFVVEDELGYYIQGFVPSTPMSSVDIIQSKPTQSFILMFGNEVFDYSKKPQDNLMIEVDNLVQYKNKVSHYIPLNQTPEFSMWLSLYEAIKNHEPKDKALDLLKIYFSNEPKLKHVIKKEFVSFYFAPFEIALHFNHVDIIDYYLNHFERDSLLKAINHYLIFHKQKSKQLLSTQFHIMCDYLSTYQLIDFNQHLSHFSMPQHKRDEINSLYEKTKLENQLLKKVLNKTIHKI